MTTLKLLLTRPLRAVPTSRLIFPLVLALLGFCDAAYLTIEHFKNAIPPCTTGGCETVLTSAYSTVFGLPISLVGAIYYLVVLVGILAYLDTRKPLLLKRALFLTVWGFLASLYLVYLQLFVIHSICLYCMGSALTSTILFITSAVLFSKYSVTDTLAQ